MGLTFSVEVDAASDLAADVTRTDALITVEALSAARSGPAPQSVEVLIMDRSLSMAGRGKLDEAKRAMCAAIDTLPDGTHLGIVAGNHRAEVIHPADGGGVVRIDAAGREAAKRRVVSLLPEGGTAIGTWLQCADRLFAATAAEDAVHHAVLYTDGRDEHESPEALDSALAACGNRFVCDARGLGDEWEYGELLRITQQLHGTAKAVVSAADLTEDFTELMRRARRIVVPRVYLGLRLNSRFRLGFVRQTRPVEADLTGQRQQHGDEVHIPLGAWSPEVRQYHVSLRFDPDALPVDEDLRAARITLRAERPGGERPPYADTRAVVVRRRATPGFRTAQPADLTRVESQRELGTAMRACADAWQRGDLARADRELAIAVELAERLDDANRLALLRSVRVIRAGRPALRRNVTRGEMQQLGLDSTRTGALPATGAAPLTGAFPDRPADDGVHRRVCPHCGTTTTARLLKHCETCGNRFDAPSADGRGRGDGLPAVDREPGPGGHRVADGGHAPGARGDDGEPRDAV